MVYLNELDPWVYCTVAFVATLVALTLAWKLTSEKHSFVQSSASAAARPNVENVADAATFTDKTSEQKSDIDPVMYVEHIQSEVKRARSRATTNTITRDMSTSQLEEEKMIRSQQIESIYRLMMEQSDKFGIESMDDVQQQLKLYA